MTVNFSINIQKHLKGILINVNFIWKNNVWMVFYLDDKLLLENIGVLKHIL